MTNRKKGNVKSSKNKNVSVRRMNLRQILMVGLMLLAAIAFIFSSLPAGLFTGQGKNKVSSPATGNTAPLAPAFKKEGTLRFLKPDGELIKNIDIEISDTPAERNLGLMHRRSLPTDSGMLFIMEKNEPQSFWMKNTYLSLDIIYVNEDREIVSIAQQTTPLSEAQVPSNAPAKYVVEVVAGYCAANNIAVGDKIEW